MLQVEGTRHYAFTFPIRAVLARKAYLIRVYDDARLRFEWLLLIGLSIFSVRMPLEQQLSWINKSPQHSDSSHWLKHRHIQVQRRSMSWEELLGGK
jgi:hypothetical protein